MLARLSQLLVVALLVGCGWHLRGSGGGADLEGVMVYVLPEMGEGELANVTTDTLRNYGAQVVGDQPVADWVLVLLGQQTNRRTVSVTSQGQARAYELSYTLHFRVDTAEGEALLDEQTVAPQVVYQADPQNVLGRESQERRLIEQLRRQALDLMMGRLAGIPRS
ncbi:LPS-assembly lipoprotein LptE [Nitrococcus mobilis]|nr:LPS assembly lipoprotein LptE [Nitrococcus mobilis]